MALNNINVPLLTILGAFSGFSLWLLLLINRYVPWPYMDEIFHVPQAQKYCEGHFTHWDPKLTTPPGLYFLSIGAIVPLVSFFKINACSVLGLRVTNVIFAILNFYVVHQLVCKIHPSTKEITNVKRIIMSFNISLLPTLYFFTFLYYTDAGSTAITLLSYLLHLHGSHKMSATIGCLSVFFRQTNIVWVAFFAALSFWDTVASNCDDRKVTKGKKTVISRNLPIKHVAQCLLKIFQHQRRRFLMILWVSMTICFPYILVGVSFIAFVFLNGGIALGDRKAHEAGLHLAQAMYFLAFAALNMAPHVSPVSLFNRCKDVIRQRSVKILLLVVAVAISIHFGTYGHPYILADNRHYTFYLWRKLINRSWYFRYLLAPVYVASCLVLWDATDRKSTFWKLAFWVCVVGVLVPQRLIELRYFTVPYIVLRLEVAPRELSRLVLESLIVILVNLITIYVFLEYPFMWKSEHTLQRFMW